MTISVPDIVAFTESAGKSFVSKLKANISSRFGSQDVIAAFSIFDPKKVPSIDSPDIKPMVSLQSTPCIHTLVCPELLRH